MGLGVTSSSNFSYSGSGTSSSPYTGTSTNKSDNTTGYINFIVENGSGTIYYDITASSETNWDFARIKKNGTIIQQVSGNNIRMNSSFSVSNLDTVVVEYFKDVSISSFSDQATITSLYIS